MEQRRIENKLKTKSILYYSYILALLLAFSLYHLDARYLFSDKLNINNLEVFSLFSREDL